MADESFKWFDAHDAPFSLHGLCGEAGYSRLPRALFPSLRPEVRRLALETAGGRIRFRTSAPRARMKITLSDTCFKTHMTPLNMAGAELYQGNGDKTRRVCVLRPVAHGDVPFEKLDGYYLEKTIEQTAALSGEMETCTLYLPAFTGIDEVKIGLPEGYAALPAENYAITPPIVFYGSSITQGACAGRPSLSYPAQVCAALGADYVNLGFAGNALGEEELARYIAGLPMKAFVLDYDHNAPNAEWLEKTHERFFDIVRAAQPELPILIVSAPRGGARTKEKREACFAVVRRTFERALEKGDARVALLNGAAFFPDGAFDRCLEDMVHPNDYGFHLMSEKVLEALRALLKMDAQAE